MKKLSIIITLTTLLFSCSKEETTTTQPEKNCGILYREYLVERNQYADPAQKEQVLAKYKALYSYRCPQFQ